MVYELGDVGALAKIVDANDGLAEETLSTELETVSSMFDRGPKEVPRAVVVDPSLSRTLAVERTLRGNSCAPNDVNTGRQQL